jgi:hypothetical protein
MFFFVMANQDIHIAEQCWLVDSIQDEPGRDLASQCATDYNKKNHRGPFFDNTPAIAHS